MSWVLDINILKLYEGLKKIEVQSKVLPNIFTIIYARENHVALEDLVFMEINSGQTYKPFDLVHVFNADAERYGLESVSVRKGTRYTFPNPLMQGYLTAHYFYNVVKDRNGLLPYLNMVSQKFSSKEDCYKKFKRGVIWFFQDNFDLDTIHEYLLKTTTRNMDFQVFDEISSFLLVHSKKESIWEIDETDINIFCSYFQGRQDLNFKTKLEGFFDILISDFLHWWRSAFLVNELVGTPPKSNAKVSCLFIDTENLEYKLSFIIELIKDKEVINQVITVYENYKDAYSDHHLRQGILRQFAHYYKFCNDTNQNMLQFETIKNFLRVKYNDKSKKYQNLIINQLRGYFSLAMDIRFYEYLDRNPVPYSLNYKVSKYSNSSDKKVIPPSDVEGILSILPKMPEFEQLFIKLLYHTGLRIGEGLILTTDCIHEITSTDVIIYVPPFKHREEPYVIPVTKNQELLEVLLRFFELRSSFGKVPHFETGIPGMWLLTWISDDGRGIKHMSKQNANDIIKKACKLAGTKKYTNHCFRHTFAHERLNKDKMLPSSIGLLLGHQHHSSTPIYLTLTIEEKLLYFSKMFNRIQAIEEATQMAQVLSISTNLGEFRITNQCEYTRWSGTGWCSHNSADACPKRYISCYPCPNYEPLKSEAENIMSDFYANQFILENELNKKMPIRKEVMFLINVLEGIIKNLIKIDENNIEINSSLFERARNFIEKN